MMNLAQCIEYCHSNEWSEQAIEIIRIADTLVQKTSCEFMGTEHLLLAFVYEENSGVTLLKQVNENADREIATEIVSLLEPFSTTPKSSKKSCCIQRVKQFFELQTPANDIFLTPRSEGNIKTATRLATGQLNWKEGAVTCEHLLFAFFSDEENAAYHILLNAGVTYEKLLATVHSNHGI